MDKDKVVAASFGDRGPMNSHKDKVIVLDTTLRDGEQSPGVTLNADEKVEIAKHLSRLGVDVLEAGFPAASKDDFKAVHRIATEVGPLMNGRSRIGRPMVITGLARADKHDIRQCYNAISSAPLQRIHIFLPTSDLHLDTILHIDRQECLRRAVQAVTYAKSLLNDIEFSPEDALRTDRDFLCRILEAVIQSGATTINVPDTVGYSTPELYGDLVRYLIHNTDGARNVTWSTHCHNDLGLATANTLAGIAAGARQVEVTVNGIGERAGNAALEEVVMSIHTHPNLYPVYHTINTNLISLTSTLVSTLTGIVVQPNKAIVGRNAFLHQGKWHKEGVQSDRSTYEILKASDIGFLPSSVMLHKNSGRNAVRQRLGELGWDNMPDVEFQHAFERFKNLADQKKTITDSDIMALLADQVSAGGAEDQMYKLLSVQIVAGSVATPTATVKLLNTHTNEELVDAAIGTAGSISAVFGAIQRIVRRSLRLTSFDIRAVGEGIDALGQVVVKIARDESDTAVQTSLLSYQLRPNGHLGRSNSGPSISTSRRSSTVDDFANTYVGHGTHVDILIASASAYVAAINRYLEAEQNEKGSSPRQRHVNV